jgi:hypothetical protein
MPIPVLPSPIVLTLLFVLRHSSRGRPIETRSGNDAGFRRGRRGQRLTVASAARLLWLVVMAIDAAVVIFLVAACGGGGY